MVKIIKGKTLRNRSRESINDQQDQSNGIIHINTHHKHLHRISSSRKQLKSIVQPTPYFIKVNDSTKRSQQISRNSVNTHNYSQKIIKKTNHTKNFNHHRNQKRNKLYSPSIVLIPILTALLLSTIMAIIVLIFETNSKPTTTPVAILRWNPTGVAIAGITGSPGNGSDKLKTPNLAILDYQNSLYVADTGNHRIQKFLMGSSIGTTIAGNGTNGTSANQLMSPSYVLPDLNGNIRVADTGNHRIQMFSNGSLTGITIASAGGFGVSNSQTGSPFGIEYDSTSGNLYIADYSNYRVMCYAPGATSGSLVAGGHGLGTNITQLSRPVRLYLDSLTNSLLIANFYSNNVVRWPLGDSSWTLLAGNQNGTSGNTKTTLYSPVDVTLDPMGNMYVADRYNHRIQFFMNGDTEGITIAGVSAVPGSNATLLNFPWSVKLDNQLNLYVADSGNHRIQKFSRY